MLDETTDDNGRDRIEEALTPPRRVNAATGLPFGWTDANELDGLMDLLTG